MHSVSALLRRGRPTGNGSRSGDNGFSLIEVVIALALLVATIPALFLAINKGEEAVAQGRQEKEAVALLDGELQEAQQVASSSDPEALSAWYNACASGCRKTVGHTVFTVTSMSTAAGDGILEQCGSSGFAQAMVTWHVPGGKTASVVDEVATC